MIVDSSAVVAVLLQEDGHEELIRRLAAETDVGVGAPTLCETGIVLAARLGPAGKTLLARFVDEAGLAVLPFADAHWPVAVDAYLRFGKGRHPAGLNFGDCLTYAMCQVLQRPLLCIGDDFTRTDLTVVS
ncbi:MAG: type II toxin-antitoxin system VapC family toxin [Pseudonocardiales bacterium]|nr:type II toxin-antitoxin system VapC family toxin [Pseudonocardiales bacterium]